MDILWTIVQIVAAIFLTVLAVLAPFLLVNLVLFVWEHIVEPIYYFARYRSALMAEVYRAEERERDGTAEIIRDYEKKWKAEIEAIASSKANQGSGKG